LSGSPSGKPFSNSNPPPETLRSLTGRHPRCQPTQQAVIGDADLPARCHYAGDNQMVCTNLSGFPRFSSHGAVRCCQRPSLSVCALSRNGDERAQTESPGRQALAGSGRRSLGAVPVCGCQALLPAGHGSGAFLGRLRSSSAVPSALAVVAAVRLALARYHGLAQALAAHCASPLRECERNSTNQQSRNAKASPSGTRTPPSQPANANSALPLPCEFQRAPAQSFRPAPL
jgi:hypothetical protein